MEAKLVGSWKRALSFGVNAYKLPEKFESLSAKIQLFLKSNSNELHNDEANGHDISIGSRIQQCCTVSTLSIDELIFLVKIDIMNVENIDENSSA